MSVPTDILSYPMCDKAIKSKLQQIFKNIKMQLISADMKP